MRRDRLAAARRVMRNCGCTRLLISEPAAITYLCGFSASRSYLLIARDRVFLCTDFRYRETAALFCSRRSGRGAWRHVPIDRYDFSFLSPHVPRRSVVGIQSDALTLDEMVKMKRALPGVRYKSLNAPIGELSCPKTGTEIAAMRKAALIGDGALDRLLRRLRPGMTEREAAAAFDRAALDLGSEKPAFDTIVLFGARTSLPHGAPGGRRLKRGDLVLIDAGCTFRGLCSDMTRTVVFGAPSPRQRGLFSLVMRARTAALRTARAGLAAATLDRAARSVIEKAGYGPAFGHGLGHGVGRRVHERPRITPQSREILKEGCVITIEPGIYVPGFGGVRIEDMVLLKKNGSKLLTHAPRTFIELPAR